MTLVVRVTHGNDYFSIHSHALAAALKFAPMARLGGRIQRCDPTIKESRNSRGAAQDAFVRQTLRGKGARRPKLDRSSECLLAQLVQCVRISVPG